MNNIWGISLRLFFFLFFCNSNCIASNTHIIDITEKTLLKKQNELVSLVSCTEQKNVIEYMNRPRHGGCNFLKEQQVCGLLWWLTSTKVVLSEEIPMTSPLPICFDQNKIDLDSTITKKIIELNADILENYLKKKKEKKKIMACALIGQEEKEGTGNKRVDAIVQDYAVKKIKDYENEEITIQKSVPIEVPMPKGSDSARKVYLDINPDDESTCNRACVK